LSDDQKSIIFKPDQIFAYGETVSVNVRPGIATISGASLNGLSFQFTIQKTRAVENSSNQIPWDREPVANRENELSPTVKPGLTTSQYRTVPVDFPVINVSVPANGTGDGYLFLSNFSFSFVQTLSNYLLMVDDRGEPVFYHQFPAGDQGLDFKKQPNGWLTYYDFNLGAFLVMDSAYSIIDVISAQNGYYTDVHELKILPNGHMLLMIYDPQPVDMTPYGGLADASVVGLVIQELDSQKNVVFQWRSWDHLDQFPFTDSEYPLTDPYIDYIHGNAIEVDYDGHLLISTRHLNEVFKINRINGGVMWILGGKGNQFDFGTDEGFSFQHDIRRLANGNITIFDNHNLGPAPEYSRVVEYRIDEYFKTVTRVWQFRNTPDTYSIAMGNAQRLPNGNTVIGWGSANPPTITEVKPDGSEAIELVLGNGHVTYRAFRFPWVGHPTTSPALVSDASSGNPALYYSWNGATEIKSYKVYGGVTPDTMSLLKEETRTGFETSTNISSWMNDYCYYQIMPIDNQDSETILSNLVLNPGPACNPSSIFLPMVSDSN
jgi:hypothetical protein